MIFTPSVAFARQPVIRESLEWLADTQPHIALAEVVSVVQDEASKSWKANWRGQVELRITETLKGEPPATARVTSINPSAPAVGAEYLLFFDQDKNVHEALRKAWTMRFDYLQTKEAILEVLKRRFAQATPSPSGTASGKLPPGGLAFGAQRGFLRFSLEEDPPGHPVLLYRAYLIVPADLEFREQILHDARSADVLIRAQAAERLANYPDEETRQVLRGLLNDPGTSVVNKGSRWQAVVYPARQAAYDTLVSLGEDVPKPDGYSDETAVLIGVSHALVEPSKELPEHSAFTYTQQAYAAFQDGDWHAVVEAAGQALRIKPDSYTRRLYSYASQRLIEPGVQGNGSHKPVANFQGTPALKPDADARVLREAQADLAAGRYAQAATALGLLIEHQADPSAQAWTLLAQANLKVGEWMKAMSAAGWALEKDPQLREAYQVGAAAVEKLYGRHSAVTRDFHRKYPQFHNQAIRARVAQVVAGVLGLATAAARSTDHGPEQKVVIQAHWSGRGRAVWWQRFVRITSAATWRRTWKAAVGSEQPVPEVDFDHSMVLGALFPLGQELACGGVRENPAQLYFICGMVQTLGDAKYEYPTYTFVVVPRSRKPVLVWLLSKYPHTPAVIGRIGRLRK